MNKRFLLTALTIIALSLSSDAVPVSFKSYKEYREHKVQLVQEESNSLQEINELQEAVKKAIAARNQSEVKSLMEKIEAASDCLDDIRNEIMELGEWRYSTSENIIRYAQAIAANKWTKRAAGVIATCSIAKLLYNKYTRSNKSNNGENDHE